MEVLREGEAKSMHERQILVKLQNDDEQAISMLIEAYGNYIAKIAGSIGQGIFCAQDVEEICADVILSVWRNRATIWANSLKPYLAQIARNTSISRLRKNKGATVSFDDDLLVFTLDENPDERAILQEQAAILNEAVNRMGEPDREIFIRFYYLGERIDGIAKHLAINPSTIKTKLHRSRKKLRGCFEERGYRYEGSN